MTKILAFDTATAACSVALWLDGEIKAAFEVAPRQHANLLLPMIDGLLQASSLSLADCDAVAFGCGPGSFMGLRIAAGTAQGLAFGAGIPVVPVSSLRALAQMAFWQNQLNTVLAGWDARMNQIYWGVYAAKEGSMEAVINDQLSGPTEVSVPSGECCAAGNAWEIYAEALPFAIGKLLPPKQACYPHAKAIAFLAANAFERGKAIDPEAIELLYLRNKVAHCQK